MHCVRAMRKMKRIRSWLWTIKCLEIMIITDTGLLNDIHFTRITTFESPIWPCIKLQDSYCFYGWKHRERYKRQYFIKIKIYFYYHYNNFSSESDISYLNTPLVSHLSRNKLTEKHKGENQVCCFLIQYLSSDFRPQTCHHLTTYTDFLFDFSRINIMRVSPEPEPFKAVTSNTFRRLSLMITFVSALLYTK